MVGSTPAIGEQDLPAIVMDLGVANGAGLVFEQDGQAAGGQIKAAKAPLRSVDLLARVECVVTEVFVPMAAGAGLADGKDDFGRQVRLGRGDCTGR